jgi:hypothetical protein
MTTIQLRPSIEEDIHHFFTFQLDAEANHLKLILQQYFLTKIGKIKLML